MEHKNRYRRPATLSQPGPWPFPTLTGAERFVITVFGTAYALWRLLVRVLAFAGLTLLGWMLFGPSAWFALWSAVAGLVFVVSVREWAGNFRRAHRLLKSTARQEEATR